MTYVMTKPCPICRKAIDQATTNRNRNVQLR